jgi:alkylhydroperoxidase family enzyme
MIPPARDWFGENRGFIGILANAPTPRLHHTGIGQRHPPRRSHGKHVKHHKRLTPMTSFPVYTLESAPERSKPALQQLQSAFGMIPNIAAAMATSPVLINSLVGLFGNVHGGSFTEAQVQIILLTDAVTNGSAWAVAFHTTLALKEGIDPADVQAIREGRLPKDGKFAALSGLAKTLIEKRGRLDEADINRFLAAGFGKDHLLEVIAAVAASTITNYTASITRPPLEAPFQEHAWAA